MKDKKERPKDTQLARTKEGERARKKLL